MIEYGGYVGTFRYDPEIEAFHGEVVNTRDVITFGGASVAELKREMANSVDEYIALCKERGRDPEKPFRGEFLVRADPELHREIAAAAAAESESFNAFVVRKLREQFDLPAEPTARATSATAARGRKVRPRAGAGKARSRKRSTS